MNGPRETKRSSTRRAAGSRGSKAGLLNCRSVSLASVLVILTIATSACSTKPSRPLPPLDIIEPIECPEPEQVRVPERLIRAPKPIPPVPEDLAHRSPEEQGSFILQWAVGIIGLNGELRSQLIGLIEWAKDVSDDTAIYRPE